MVFLIFELTAEIIMEYFSFRIVISVLRVIIAIIKTYSSYFNNYNAVYKVLSIPFEEENDIVKHNLITSTYFMMVIYTTIITKRILPTPVGIFFNAIKMSKRNLLKIMVIPICEYYI